MVSSKKVRVGVGVLIYKDEKVLLIKRRGSHGEGTWAPPGGHLDYGEDPFECARRETLEEVSLNIDNLRFKGITNDIFHEGKHYITLWVESDYLSGQVVVNHRELTDYKWSRMDDLPTPLFQSMKNLLDGKLYSSHGV